VPITTRAFVLLSLFASLAACADGSDDPDDLTDHGQTRVVVLADTHYVDFVLGDPTAEGSNLLASFDALGYDTHPLAHWTPDSLDSALAGAKVFVVPEFTTAAWAARPRALDTLMTEFVEQGGILVQGWFLWPLDTLFGWQVYDTVGGSPRFPLHPPFAIGTPFADGPDSLADQNMTYATDFAKLPAGAIAPWRNDSSHVPFFAAPVGQGWVVWLGWDWWRAAPMGPHDGGWLAVLDRIDRLP
jgi:hypothetical protein